MYTQQWYMSYRFVDSFRSGPGRNCSSILVLVVEMTSFQPPDMHDFEGTETIGNIVLHFVRPFSYDIYLIRVYTITSCVWHCNVYLRTKKECTLHCSLHACYRQQVKLDFFLPKCRMMLCTYCILGDRTGGESRSCR
jgi:hypothetical protein